MLLRPFLLTFLLCINGALLAQKADLPELTEPNPKFYALLIAAQGYKNPGFTQLSKPYEDAKALKDIFVNKYNFEPNGTILLLDKSREEILNSLDILSRSMTENDNLVIFFAGHGSYLKDPSNGDIDGFLIPVSGEMDKYYTFISSFDLATPLKRCRAKHILLITDACYSGSFVNKSRNVFDNAPLDIKILADRKSRQLMASGNLTPVPDNSQFIKYLIKALNENTQNFVTSGQLFSQLRPEAINNTGGTTTPICGVLYYMDDEQGEFIFVQNMAGMKEKLASNGASIQVRFFTGTNATIYVDNEIIGSTGSNPDILYQIKPGKHVVKAVSLDIPEISVTEQDSFDLTKDGNSTIRWLPVLMEMYNYRRGLKASGLNEVDQKNSSETTAKINIDQTIPGVPDYPVNAMVETYSYTKIFDRPDIITGKVVYTTSGNFSERVEILEKVNALYYKVQAGGTIGFIFTEYIKGTSPQNGMTSNNGDSKNNTVSGISGNFYHDTVEVLGYSPIQDSPDRINGKVIKYVDNSQVIIVEKFNDEYYRVKWNDVSGYLFVGWIKRQL